LIFLLDERVVFLKFLKFAASFLASQRPALTAAPHLADFGSAGFGLSSLRPLDRVYESRFSQMI
jgi:hypothetical protein